MCGIAGEFQWAASASANRVRELTAKLQHRGPDASGHWMSDGGACALGHTRLSIIDLSDAASQPMLDPLTGNAIVFNGEIYNYRNLRDELMASGERFTSASDTEVILALYRRYGPDCLQHLRGMFALAVWDNRARHLFLARDRVGKKPLNYARTPTGLVFSSELDALSRQEGIDSSLDFEALQLYLQLQYIPAPWTIYKGIRKLPAAHYAIVAADRFDVVPYWNVSYRSTTRRSEAEIVDEFEEKLTEAVRLRMISDVPIGALLSGGVDSSVIVALMSRISAQPIRTYSMGFREQQFSELDHAQFVADRLRTVHHPEILEGDVAAILPTIVRRYGEPFADSSAVPSFFVAKAARRHVKVVLNGDGGDELLGGYHRYAANGNALRRTTVLSRAIPPALLARISPLLSDVTTLHGRAVRKVILNYVAPEVRSLLMYSDFWSDRDRAELLPDCESSNVLPAWRAYWLASAFRHAANPVDRMLWLDNRTYLAGDLLPKMDIAAMHCGLEGRSPLLDHKVIEFAATLPAGLKVRGRTGKYLLKKLAERYFPREFIQRPKMGFGIPRASWLRGPLAALANDVLRDDHAMWPLSRARIDRLIKEFSESDVDEGRVWALLMYGVWRRERFQ